MDNVGQSQRINIDVENQRFHYRRGDSNVDGGKERKNTVVMDLNATYPNPLNPI